MFKKSLTSILAKFQSTIDELKALESANEKAIEQNNDHVAALERRRSEIAARIAATDAHSIELSHEAQQAAVVRERIEALIKP